MSLSKRVQAALVADDWSEFPNGVNQIVEEIEKLENKFNSFEMRFGSYGTFTADDILTEISRLDKKIKLSESSSIETEKRIKQIEAFLYNYEWKKFTVNDAIKCLEHIKTGGGWL